MMRENQSLQRPPFRVLATLSVLLSLALAIIAGSVTPPVGAATTFLVTSSLDAADQSAGDGVCASTTNDCTLRAALQEANALSGMDTVLLPAGRYVLALGSLEISDDLLLLGDGATTTIVDADQIDRVFDVTGRATVTISGITIRQGRGDGPGGGILNRGTLTVTRSIIAENFGTGGGIFNDGTLTIIQSAIVSNTVDGDSNGGRGAGINQNEGSLSIINTTISGNFAAEGAGGGIYVNSGQVTVESSTIANNSAAMGSGLANFDNVAMEGTILSNNRPGENCALAVTSQGHNLSTDTSCELMANEDQQGVDPQLGPLADNGGQTLTQALGHGSPAIDNGGNTCPATDQRGIARPQGAACDIGAYEDIPPGSTATPTPTSTATLPATNTPQASSTPTITPTRTATSTSTPTPLRIYFPTVSRNLGNG